VSRSIIIKRDRAVPVDAKLLRQIVSALLRDLLALENFELGIHLVRADEMTRINETFLQHKGSTDVITFGYSEAQSSLHGEIFICYDEAILQARRFKTTWQSEIVRYLIHGVLHLLGFDDHRAIDRRKMKREENRLLREITRRFPISKLARRRASS
jgi:probable rRNA maturation factor